jgi:hypothetical protein
MNNFLLFFIMIGLAAAHIQCMDGEVKSPVENEGAPRTRARTGQAPRPFEAPEAVEAKDAQEQTERSSATTGSLEAKVSQTDPSVKQSDKSKDVTAQTASQTSADSGIQMNFVDSVFGNQFAGHIKSLIGAHEAAAQSYSAAGDHTNAALLNAKVAEKALKAGDRANATKFYTKAAESSTADKDHAGASTLYTKAAESSIADEDHVSASTLYTKAAESSTTSGDHAGASTLYTKAAESAPDSFNKIILHTKSALSSSAGGNTEQIKSLTQTISPFTKDKSLYQNIDLADAAQAAKETALQAEEQGHHETAGLLHSLSGAASLENQDSSTTITTSLSSAAQSYTNAALEASTAAQNSRGNDAIEKYATVGDLHKDAAMLHEKAENKIEQIVSLSDASLSYAKAALEASIAAQNSSGNGAIEKYATAAALYIKAGDAYVSRVKAGDTRASIENANKLYTEALKATEYIIRYAKDEDILVKTYYQRGEILEKLAETPGDNSITNKRRAIYAYEKAAEYFFKQARNSTDPNSLISYKAGQKADALTKALKPSASKRTTKKTSKVS